MTTFSFLFPSYICISLALAWLRYLSFDGQPQISPNHQRINNHTNPAFDNLRRLYFLRRRLLPLVMRTPRSRTLPLRLHLCPSMSQYVLFHRHLQFFLLFAHTPRYIPNNRPPLPLRPLHTNKVHRPPFSYTLGNRTVLQRVLVPTNGEQEVRGVPRSGIGCD